VKPDLITFMREAFRVKRWHTVPHVVSEETVGAHTANMLMLVFYLYDGKPPLESVWRTMMHDAPELLTGDIPAPAKWRSKPLNAAVIELEREICKELEIEVNALPHLDEMLLHYADLMDLCFKAVEEISLGNVCFFGPLSRGVVAVKAILNSELKGHLRAHGLYKELSNNPYVQIPDFDGAEGVNNVKH